MYRYVGYYTVSQRDAGAALETWLAVSIILGRTRGCGAVYNVMDNTQQQCLYPTESAGPTVYPSSLDVSGLTESYFIPVFVLIRISCRLTHL